MMPFRTFPSILAGVMVVALAGPGMAAPLQHVAQANTEGATRPATGGTDTGPSRNAARSRVRECGHQWSSMKKSGAAAGMTWKDFSQGCLAKQ